MPNKVYISYARKSKKTKVIISELEEALKKAGLKSVRDVCEIMYRDNIEKFMDEFGTHKYVVIVLSKQYFKSEYCMYELIAMDKNGSFQDKIYPIIVKNIDILDNKKIIEYEEYWIQESKDLNNKLEILPAENRIEYYPDLKKIKEINLNIKTLLSIIRNLYSPSSEYHSNQNFTEIIGLIQQNMEKDKLTKRGIVSREQVKENFDSIEKVSDTWSDTAEWLRKNKRLVVDMSINELLLSKGKYVKKLATDNNLFFKFKQNIIDHIEYLIAVFHSGSNNIPLEDYVHDVDIITSDAYIDFFNLMFKKINEENINTLRDDELLLLSKWMGFLINHYRHL